MSLFRLDNPQRELWTSALALCLLSPFMAEVLSSNLTPLRWLFLLWGLVPVYGFPLLLMREWAIRRRISPLGIFFMGFGYGFYNEGLIAKTLLQTDGLPWESFNGTYSWGGLSWGWLLVICAWHGLFSVLTPLFLIEHWRPQTAGKTWLSPRPMAWLLAALLLVSTGYFGNLPRSSPLFFPIFWALIAFFVGLGSCFRGDWPVATTGRENRRVLLALSVPILLVWFVLSAGAQHGWPFALFVALFGVHGAATLFAARKAGAASRNGLILLGLGAYAGMCALIVGVSHPLARVVDGAALLGIVFLLRRGFPAQKIGEGQAKSA